MSTVLDSIIRYNQAMVNIRIARKDEVSELQELNSKAFADNPKFDSDFFKEWSFSKYAKNYYTNLLSNPEAICLVVEEDNQLIGYAAIVPKTIHHRLSKYCEIENIGIVPEYRRQGIGKKLLEECCKWARSKGYQKIYLNSYFKNTNALSFYRQNGFAEIDISLEKAL